MSRPSVPLGRPPAAGTPGPGLLTRLETFFTERIWVVRVRDLPRRRRFAYRVGRIAYSTARGFLRNRLTMRAAALTYYSVLSLVPFLAFAFATLKGLGAYSSFIEHTVRPYLDATFHGSPALLEALNRIMGFVSRTDVSTLGAVGLLTLVYTSVSLLGSIEAALNDIWGAEGTRPFLRQVTDYVTLLVTAPLLVVVATSFATAAQSWDAVEFLRRAPGVGPVLASLPRLLSVLTVGVALFALYAILPNVKTRPRSALIGAAVSAVLWQGALALHVRFQIGIAGYNALYSALSAIPIFLFWTYVSWIVVLLGAQVAASHQNERVVRQAFHAERMDQELRETIAVAAAAAIARAFLAGRAPAAVGALAASLEVPPAVVERVCDELARAGLLLKAAGRREATFVPARDLGGVTVADVREALRRDARADPARLELEQRLSPELRRLLAAGREAVRASPVNLTLRELGTMAGSRGDDAPVQEPEPARPPPGAAGAVGPPPRAT